MSTYENIRYDYALPSGYGGALVHIKTLTASSSSNLSFVHGSSDVVLDSTYRTYIFKLINIHPSAQAFFGFNFSTDAGSNYNATKTSTNFRAYHDEGDSSTDLDYKDGDDIAQGTGQVLTAGNLGTGNDESLSGELWLFNPSSTTYVKHFIWRSSCVQSAPAAFDCYVTGYANTTSDVDAVQFAMASGNIDSGTIKLYGIA
tara:strand:+ start:505 stop:1107 length:603 start_codon:yes stop_codon:yes gene_type:complete